MKVEEIRVNADRARANPGGAWQASDPVTQGRVQVLSAGTDEKQQALAVYTEITRLMGTGLELSGTAVIAREWTYLEPLRAVLEAVGIPVAMADEEAPPLWRLRETRALLAYLEKQMALSRSGFVKAGDMTGWLAGQGEDGWWPALREAVDAFAEDSRGAEVSFAYFRDWLAEWGRASRQRQAGVLLLTAHRAKGLEFDHVFVLDGAWRVGRGEDQDSVRRLYYVAMTRARATLTLARMDAGNASLEIREEAPCYFKRPAASWLPAPDGIDYRYCLPSLKEIDLGYVGGCPESHPVHRVIAGLRTGDALRYCADERGARLEDAIGTTVARFSKAFKPPEKLRCVQARVRAVLVWRKSDSRPEYQARCRCDAWEVVLPELVFAP